MTTGRLRPVPLPMKGKTDMDWPTSIALVGFFAVIGFIFWVLAR